VILDRFFTINLIRGLFMGERRSLAFCHLFLICGGLLLGAPWVCAADSAISATGAENNPLQEIVVTAEKRDERLQDVPMAVTAISAEELISNNQLSIADYYSSVPGLTLGTSSFGAPSIIIRGIATGTGTLQNPTVGVTVDGVPYGSSTPLGGGSIIPDIDPSDLARLEVLRGPQGTLYGVGSMGGLLKFVTVDPSTDAVTGRVQADLNSVYNGDGLGYGVRAAVNVPVNEFLAVRVSGYTRLDPGYIDNVVSGAQGVNRSTDYGGRVSLLWRPSDTFSIKLSALSQDDRRDGPGGVIPALGDLKENYIPGIGGYDRRYQVFSANMDAKLGIFDLTSITGYSVNSLRDGEDLTSGLGGLISQIFYPAVYPNPTGVPFTEDNQTSKFSQEVRLNTNLGSYINLMVGGFYTHEYSPYTQSFYAANATTGIYEGPGVNFAWLDRYEEYAGFADLTVRFTDHFDIQLGGRESENHQIYTEVDTGPWTPVFDGFPSPVNYGRDVTRENAFTYLVTPRYKLSEDLMAYARIASGYRPGGPNPLPSADHVLPNYSPDKTVNYEVGVKGDVLDHLLSFDTSVYYIDWNKIQLSALTPLDQTYYVNGSKAKSEGIEFSTQLRPTQGLVISTWVAWDEAQLTRDLPSNAAIYATAGDRLPYSSRFSGNVSVDESFALPGALTGMIGGAVSYVGDREGMFTSTAASPRAYLPSYAKTDLHAGVKYQAWTVNLFANNVTDRRGVLDTDQSLLTYIIPPRVIGISVMRTF
jgi:iron complex outermembrane recepter protein